MIYKSVADFRKSLRSAFNAADTGENIEVIRYGKLYRLVPVGNAAKISSDTATKVNKMLFAEARSNSKNFCPNGHAIPDSRDRCLGKGCKYA